MPSSRRRRGDDGGQPAGLELLLDQAALLLGHRAVVGAGDLGDDTVLRAPRRRPGLRHHGGRLQRAGVGQRLAGDALVVDLVQPGAEPLGEPAGVGEDDGRAVRGDEVDDALLDVRPDRRTRSSPAAEPLTSPVVCAELAEVLDRDDDLELDLLGGRRLDDLDVVRTAEEAGDLLDGSDRRRQPDPLGRLRQQLVEPLQRQGEVRAALGPGDRVHLVDDDGLDAAQRLAGLRGEHQEQRLRGGDQDVGRRTSETAPLVGRGVAGADADREVGLRQPQPGRGVPDAGQRGAQVALDVDGQRLHRRDVEDPAAVPAVGRGRLAGQPVERPQERGQRLAGPGRGDHQGVAARADGVPRARPGPPSAR